MIRDLAGRTAVGALLVATLGGVVAVGSQGTSNVRQRPATRVTVPATSVALTCPGAVELPAPVSAGSQFDPVPVAPVTLLHEVGSSGVASVDGQGVAVVGPTTVDGAAVVRFDASSGTMAAGTVTTVAAGDLRGLLGASCQLAGTDQWLVGGSTDLGSNARLVLVNSGSTPAVVTWTVWSGTGPVGLDQASTLVPAGTSAMVNLAGTAGTRDSLVTRVRSTGGRVWAHVQDDAIDGYTPAGADLVVAGSAPARRQVVAGLLLEASDVGTGTLRLLAPDGSGTASVQLFGADGPVDLPGGDRVGLTGGQVVDVPLGGLPTGRYTVVVDADVAVVAGAVVLRVGAAGDLDPVPRTERAVAVAAQGGTGTVVVPATTRATLVVGAVGSGEDPAARSTGSGTLDLLDADGQVLRSDTLRVDAGTTGAWGVSDLVDDPTQVAALRVRALDGAVLHWALVVEQDGPDGTLITILQPTPPAGGDATVAVARDPELGRG